MSVDGNGVRVVTQGGRPLPPRPENLHRPHRPWCVACKTKHDATDLDDSGRCRSCAVAVVTRAQGEARRAARATAAVQAEQQLLAAPKQAPRRRPTKPRAMPVVMPVAPPLTGIRGTDRSTAAKLRQLGSSPREVKQWAVEQGLLTTVARGRVPGDILDAFSRSREGAAT